ncbi:hypothetical protein AB3U99_20420 [Niallia sp. JL1B1071]|uniref:hypothetical protein n=1 Tax=Niallia tiangongensis TaxID=3237105 RepID=UPI0037DCF8B3
MSFSLSPIGFVLAIGLLLPNILFIIFFSPKNIPSKTRSTPFIFIFLERIGQIGCLFLLSITTNPVKFIDVWLILSFLCLLLYYLLWIRYVRNDRDYRFLTKSFLFMPIPLALLPCCIFFAIAIWGHSIWLGIAAIIFAIGHLKVSLDSGE